MVYFGELPLVFVVQVLDAPLVYTVVARGRQGGWRGRGRAPVRRLAQIRCPAGLLLLLLLLQFFFLLPLLFFLLSRHFRHAG